MHCIKDGQDVLYASRQRPGHESGSHWHKQTAQKPYSSRSTGLQTDTYTQEEDSGRKAQDKVSDHKFLFMQNKRKKTLIVNQSQLYKRLYQYLHWNP